MLMVLVFLSGCLERVAATTSYKASIFQVKRPRLRELRVRELSWEYYATRGVSGNSLNLDLQLSSTRLSCVPLGKSHLFSEPWLLYP